MSRSALVLGSPLLPSAAYQPLAEALSAAGHPAAVAPTTGLATLEDFVDAWVGAAHDHEVLVAHSNAGYLAPSVRAAVGGLHPIVFVDAALPPLSGSTRLAPPGLREHLADLADSDGLLPPWTRWWSDEQLHRTLPEVWREPIDRLCPQLPLRYFDSVVEAPAGWSRGANAYVAFGDTYADEVTFALAHRWPVARLAGAGHLHFLHEPEAVVRTIISVLTPM